jgi:hypothetical protein
MNAKLCKKLRRDARVFAAANKLPERQMIGGLHRIERREYLDPITNEPASRLMLIASQGFNERMTFRGVYRALKKGVR